MSPSYAILTTVATPYLGESIYRLDAVNLMAVFSSRSLSPAQAAVIEFFNFRPKAYHYRALNSAAHKGPYGFRLISVFGPIFLL